MYPATFRHISPSRFSNSSSFSPCSCWAFAMVSILTASFSTDTARLPICSVAFSILSSRWWIRLCSAFTARRNSSCSALVSGVSIPCYPSLFHPCGYSFGEKFVSCTHSYKIPSYQAYSPVWYISCAPCTGTNGRAVPFVFPCNGLQKVNHAGLSGLMSGYTALSCAWKHSQVWSYQLRISPTSYFPGAQTSYKPETVSFVLSSLISMVGNIAFTMTIIDSCSLGIYSDWEAFSERCLLHAFSSNTAFPASYL